LKSSQRWQPADQGLRWVSWDGESEVVAFSPRSSSAHLLTPAVRTLLETLSITPRTFDEIAALYPGDWSSADITALVHSLDEAGLIEPV
jgi:hypothetical protein